MVKGLEFSVVKGLEFSVVKGLGGLGVKDVVH